jgi:hypothetical protein
MPPNLGHESLVNDARHRTPISLDPAAPEPGGLYVAECGPYSFDICRMLDDTGYALQVWQLRPEDWPLVVWELDSFSLEETKDRAKHLAAQHVPVSIQG